jgi:hypothetical protein
LGFGSSAKPQRGCLFIESGLLGWCAFVFQAQKSQAIFEPEKQSWDLTGAWIYKQATPLGFSNPACPNKKPPPIVKFRVRSRPSRLKSPLPMGTRAKTWRNCPIGRAAVWRYHHRDIQQINLTL